MVFALARQHDLNPFVRYNSEQDGVIKPRSLNDTMPAPTSY